MPMAAELLDWKQRIRGWAAEEGLDFFEVEFELLDWRSLSEVAAYGGYPTRYPHWRFGMDFDQLEKGHQWGLSKIYELVINNDPCWAYLLQANALVDQKLVMAHVYGHSDFFKNNMFFAHTNRRMMDEMANHGTRVRKHIDKQGLGPVEDFIDACLSLENLIDVHSVGIRRRKPHVPEELAREHKPDEPDSPRRLRAKEYMDSFINPPDFLEAQETEIRREEEQRKHFPRQPERDVLLFLLEHAPLESWERDILAIVRDEAYYFAPQKMTKIMNEGWASYWHSRIMTEHALEADELLEYADHHAGVLGAQPGRLNPYKLGLELFRNIEERWDTGRHGPEWERCDNAAERARWDTGAMEGRDKIFQVRRAFNDVTFVDEFLTPEFCRDHKLFTYRFNHRTGRHEIEGRDFDEIKRSMLFSLTNFGQPIIRVTDANFLNRGELVLEHQVDPKAGEEQDLDTDQAEDTLEKLHMLWRRPVHIETVVQGKRRRLSFDGDEHDSEDLGREF